MIQYLSINAIIKFYKLGNLLMKEIFLYDSGTFMSIISDKSSVFISDYWSELCYHIKIKQQLSITFYSQINNQTKQQN